MRYPNFTQNLAPFFLCNSKLLHYLHQGSSLVAHWFQGTVVLILVGENICHLSFLSRDFMIAVYLRISSWAAHVLFRKLTHHVWLSIKLKMLIFGQKVNWTKRLPNEINVGTSPCPSGMTSLKHVPLVINFKRMREGKGNMRSENGQIWMMLVKGWTIWVKIFAETLSTKKCT